MFEHANGTYVARYQDFSKVGFMVLDIRPSSVGVRVYTVDIATAVATLAYRRRLA